MRYAIPLLLLFIYKRLSCTWAAGGGPGGLLAALGLLTALPQAKVKVRVQVVAPLGELVEIWSVHIQSVQVYEKVKGYGECGAGIALVVNGLKVGCCSGCPSCWLRVTFAAKSGCEPSEIDLNSATYKTLRYCLLQLSQVNRRPDACRRSRP